MKTAINLKDLCVCRDCQVEARALGARTKAIRRVKRERKLRWCQGAALYVLFATLFVVGGIYAMGWALSVAPTLQ